MPNRADLAMRVLPLDKPADDIGILTVVGFCAIGTLASICFAMYFQSLDQVPALLSQVPFG